jgi:enamine deaminase RidA (YjgF/YER057c/UK114 family)
VGLLAAARLASAVAAEEVRYIDPQEADGSSAAVVVPDEPLAFTRQLLPFDRGSRLSQESGTRQQIDEVLRRAIGGAGRVVKLNVVAANLEVAEEVRRALAEKFAGRQAKPAVSYVISKLPQAGALVAMDAVWILPGEKVERAERRPSDPEFHSRIPAGSKVYVSGQAEKGKDIEEMTRATMNSLGATLEHLGLGWEDVAQVKAFIGPIAEAETARHEIEKRFDTSPPIVFVEWTTAPSIEIELVASAVRAAGKSGDTVEFITPPGMTASPVFCRVTRVPAGPTIFISGLYGKSQGDGQQETLEVFEQLGSLLDKTGSDFRHLVKATYYVSTDEAGRKLNELRPRFYDPERPPAASKAPVAGTGREGKTITLDMIAARAPK